MLLVFLSAVIGLNYLYILANEIIEHRSSNNNNQRVSTNDHNRAHRLVFLIKKDKVVLLIENPF